MKQEEFIKRQNKYVRVIFNDDLDRTDYRYLEIKSWFMDIKALKTLTSLIDFGCNFDDTGLCRLYRNTEYNPRCCCNNCHGATGHFTNIQLTDTPKIARHFKEKVGFWRKGRGCILPRELRSDTCITYICNTYKSGENQPEPARTQARAIATAIGMFRTKIRERSIELELR